MKTKHLSFAEIECKICGEKTRCLDVVNLETSEFMDPDIDGVCKKCIINGFENG